MNTLYLCRVEQGSDGVGKVQEQEEQAVIYSLAVHMVRKIYYKKI